MPASDVLQATLAFSQNGQKLVNVLHFEQTTADGALNPAADLAAAINAAIWPSYALCLADAIELQGINCRRIDPTPGGNIYTPIASPGLIAQEAYPPNSCAVAILYTAFVGAVGRGRIHIPGVPITFAEGGRINNGDAATYVTFLNTLLAPISTGGGATFQCGVWSTVNTVLYPLTGHQLKSQLRTLRGRRMDAP
jgi:hypothetical protein